MDFGFTQEQEDLRQEVRAFIADNVSQGLLDEMEGGEEGGRGHEGEGVFLGGREGVPRMEKVGPRRRGGGRGSAVSAVACSTSPSSAPPSRATLIAV